MTLEAQEGGGGHTRGLWEVYAQPIGDAEDAKAELAFQVDNTDPIGDTLYLINAGGKCPALTGCGPTSEANARRIVTAVNSHDALLEALKLFVDFNPSTAHLREVLRRHDVGRAAIQLAEGR